MITFGITTHNEGQYIQTLLNQLIPHCKISGDEIIIVDDFSTDALTKEILNAASDNNVRIYYHKLNMNFAAHKNVFKEFAKGEYIFQIDADEILHPNLLENIGSLTRMNDDVDLFFVPRVNIVEGMTEEDIVKYKWKVNENGWIQFPDFQTRVYKNKNVIRWEGKVHERIMGHKSYAALPAEEIWALRHVKQIERQREQNEFYATL